MTSPARWRSHRKERRMRHTRSVRVAGQVDHERRNDEGVCGAEPFVDRQLPDRARSVLCEVVDRTADGAGGSPMESGEVQPSEIRPVDVSAHPSLSLFFSSQTRRSKAWPRLDRVHRGSATASASAARSSSVNGAASSASSKARATGSAVVTFFAVGDIIRA